MGDTEEISDHPQHHVHPEPGVDFVRTRLSSQLEEVLRRLRDGGRSEEEGLESRRDQEAVDEESRELPIEMSEEARAWGRSMAERWKPLEQAEHRRRAEEAQQAEEEDVAGTEV